MTRPARSVPVTLRRAPRRRAAKPEAIVAGIPELRIALENETAIVEILANLLVDVLAREKRGAGPAESVRDALTAAETPKARC